MAANEKNLDSDSCDNLQKKEEISVVDTLIKNIKNERDLLLVRIFAETGCTSYELVNLKCEDVDFGRSVICFCAENTKKKSRNVSVSKELSLDLKKICENAKKFVFSSRKCPKLSTRSIRRIFERYSKIIGTRITSRDLRYWFIQNSMRKKVPLEDIKKTVGIKRLDKKEFLTKAEFERVRKCIEKKRDLLILDLLFETGCTVEELTSILVKDIEVSQKKMIFAPTKQKRSVVISDRLGVEIKEFIAEKKATQELFSSWKRKGISSRRVFQLIKKYAKLASVEGNLKILRYAHIANALSSGSSVEEVSQRTGIKNLGRFHLYGNLGVRKSWSLKNKNE